jgi:hypothetical protein
MAALRRIIYSFTINHEMWCKLFYIVDTHTLLGSYLALNIYNNHFPDHKLQKNVGKDVFDSFVSSIETELDQYSHKAQEYVNSPSVKASP